MNEKDKLFFIVLGTLVLFALLGLLSVTIAKKEHQAGFEKGFTQGFINGTGEARAKNMLEFSCAVESHKYFEAIDSTGNLFVITQGDYAGNTVPFQMVSDWINGCMQTPQAIFTWNDIKNGVQP